MFANLKVRMVDKDNMRGRTRAGARSMRGAGGNSQYALSRCAHRNILTSACRQARPLYTGSRAVADAGAHPVKLLAKLVEKQETSKAMELFEEGRRGGDKMAATKLGALYMQQGQTSKAMELFEEGRRGGDKMAATKLAEASA